MVPKSGSWGLAVSFFRVGGKLPPTEEEKEASQVSPRTARLAWAPQLPPTPPEGVVQPAGPACPTLAPSPHRSGFSWRWPRLEGTPGTHPEGEGSPSPRRRENSPGPFKNLCCPRRENAEGTPW